MPIQETADGLVKIIFDQIKAKNEVYTRGDFIYTIKSLDSLRDYLNGFDETPILKGCRIGQLFHEEIYRAEIHVLEKALRQIFRYTNNVAVEISRRGAKQLDCQKYEIIN